MYQNSIKKWLVAGIKPNSHDLAVRNLERQGFETFLPKMKKTIKKETKFIEKEELLFPGYAFIGIVLQNSNLAKINSTYGVSKLLSFNNKPYEIPYNLILALKKRWEDTIINEKLKSGDTIKFNNGPFADLITKIESVDSKKRIYIFLDVMGGQRKLEINLNKKINIIKV